MRENHKIRLNLFGKKFSRWKVIGFSHINKHRNTVWNCVCECGNTRNVVGGALTSGASKSCGCLKADRARETHGLPPGTAAKNSVFDRYKRGAESRNLEFQLSFDEFDFLTGQNCSYCGIAPSRATKARGCKGEFIYNGIDRVDNSKGYILENCVPCCETCNRAKRTMSVNEFFAWIDRVYEHKRPKQLFDYHIVYTDLVVPEYDDGTAKWWKELNR